MVNASSDGGSIKNIYEEGELDLLSTVSKKEIVRKKEYRCTLSDS